ncbi:MAG: RNA polymerase factor sigma-54 [Deltaproteobacteria bacterium]|jgi:RNA polymerase sigma-54 factor|nr:RNA polymerase factor sigma-54 [Deltaproteobacteria bacterium]
MEIKLVQGLQQKLVMTPQLQMAIKLLQLSRLELIDAVREEMMGNPILEDGADGNDPIERAAEAAETPTIDRVAALDDSRLHLPTSQEDRAAISETTQEDYWEKFLDAYSNQAPLPTTSRGSSEDMPSLEATLTRRTTLSDHLEQQIRLSNFRENELKFAMLIVHNLDDSGYLNLSGIVVDEDVEGEAPKIRAAAETEAAGRALTIEDLAVEVGLDPEDAEEVLRLIQSLDPVGVAARDLRECLLVQAEHFGYDSDNILWQVIDRHLPNVERRNFQAIARDLHCELTDVYEAARFISTMEPRPGRNFTSEEPSYITPDVYVHKVGDDYVVSTNDDGMPKLKINEQQARSLMKDPKAREFVQGKLASAKWFVRSLDQRQKTIVKVTQSIVEKQHDFFEKGIEFLKPMILRDVADAVGMHESTISRVTTNKYVHTPRGIFELKYFFNSSIRRIAEEDIASESVKQAIKKIVAQEDAQAPLSDEQIVKELVHQKIVIARRTVAKYREMLGILSSAKRKQYY